jgi:hypothetical protein
MPWHPSQPLHKEPKPSHTPVTTFPAPSNTAPQSQAHRLLIQPQSTLVQQDMSLQSQFSIASQQQHTSLLRLSNWQHLQSKIASQQPQLQLPQPVPQFPPP